MQVPPWQQQPYDRQQNMGTVIFGPSGLSPHPFLLMFCTSQQCMLDKPNQHELVVFSIKYFSLVLKNHTVFKMLKDRFLQVDNCTLPMLCGDQMCRPWSLGHGSHSTLEQIPARLNDCEWTAKAFIHFGINGTRYGTRCITAELERHTGATTFLVTKIICLYVSFPCPTQMFSGVC